MRCDEVAFGVGNGRRPARRAPAELTIDAHDARQLHDEGHVQQHAVEVKLALAHQTRELANGLQAIAVAGARQREAQRRRERHVRERENRLRRTADRDVGNASVTEDWTIACIASVCWRLSVDAVCQPSSFGGDTIS